MSGALWYRGEIDLQKIVDEQARKVQRRVDEATLDKVADTLADFGYVKVNGNNRWFELFGTPERAALTLESILCDYRRDGWFCLECKLHDGCYGSCSIVEWLRGDAE